MKLVVADPKTGKTYQTELDEGKSKTLYGKKLSDTVNGDPLGLPGYELQITGGSDKQGFPMRFDLHGTNRKRIMLSIGPGFHPTKRGERKRKSVRGNTISEEVAQINAKVLKQGSKSLEQVFGKEEAPKEEKAPKDEKKEASKKEEKPKEETKKGEPKNEKKEAPKKEEKPEEKGEKK